MSLYTFAADRTQQMLRDQLGIPEGGLYDVCVSQTRDDWKNDNGVWIQTFNVSFTGNEQLNCIAEVGLYDNDCVKIVLRQKDTIVMEFDHGTTICDAEYEEALRALYPEPV